jgi:hypothetical protein
MGDKSPKAKEKSKKQDVASKNKQKAAAIAKANPPSGSMPHNKGK